MIKELKVAVAQYGPMTPFTQALLDTVIESDLTPQDWRTLYKATLSGGDFLLWKSEWCEASKRTSTMNSQVGHRDWDSEMLLGEGLYGGNTNQIGFPIGVYAQVAMTSCHEWNLLPSKGDISGSLTGIRQAPDELFHDFCGQIIENS